MFLDLHDECTLVKGLPGFDLHQLRLCCQRELFTKLRSSAAQWCRELWISWTDLISLISAFTARGDWQWPGAQWLINRSCETWISLILISTVLISSRATLGEKLDGQLCEWSPAQDPVGCDQAWQQGSTFHRPR